MLDISERQQSVEKQLERASHLTEQLKTTLEEFSLKKGEIEEDVQEFLDWVTQTKEFLKQTDDTSGTDEDLLRRLESAQVIHHTYMFYMY